MYGLFGVEAGIAAVDHIDLPLPIVGNQGTPATWSEGSLGDGVTKEDPLWS